MADLKLLRIEEGDSQSNLTDKANYNFASLLSFGGGPYGRIGDQGPEGAKGPIGPVGSYGYFGGRGSIWTVGPCQPSVSSSISGDFWMNSANANSVYQFVDGGWEYYGFNLKAQDLFSLKGPLSTSSGVSTRYGYFLSPNTPINYTVVISDNSSMSSGTELSPNVFANPQYSKFVIATNGATGSTGERNILEFSKGDYSSSSSFQRKTPRFYWLLPDVNDPLVATYGTYGLAFKMEDELNVNLPASNLNLRSTSRFVSFKSTGFNLYMNTPQSFTSSVLGDSVFDFGSGVAKFSTKNISYSAGQFNLSVGFNLYTQNTDSNPPLSLVSYSALAGNLRYLYNSPSDPSVMLFRTSQSGATLFSVAGNGYVYMNKKINSIQTEQTITQTSISTWSIYTINWTTVMPSVSTTTSDPNIFYVNNGSDYIIRKSGSASGGDRGICLWTPATGGSWGNNGGWLNLLENEEAISFRVRSYDPSSSSDHFQFIGLNTTNNQSGSPSSFNSSYNTELIRLPNPASTVEFTIVTITGSGGTGGTRRWYKVYYSAWGGGLIVPYCGILTTLNSTA